MKHLLLLLLFLPARIFAQYDADSPQGFTPDVVKFHHVKSERVVTLVTHFSGTLTTRDSIRFDTAVIVNNYYNRNGHLTETNYHSVLEKSNFSSHTVNVYDSTGQIIRQIKVTNDSFADSTVFAGHPPHLVIHKYWKGDHGPCQEIATENGDSVTTMRIEGRDTVIHHGKKTGYTSKDHWDDEIRNNTYSKRKIYHNNARQTDSCVFYNAKGEILVTLVDHYDSLGRVACSDYYNQRIKYLSVFHAHYNLKEDMSTYIWAHKNGKETYCITRKYNAQGLLSEAVHTPPGKHEGLTVIKYAYEYYK